jgi:hypothetical protein
VTLIAAQAPIARPPNGEAASYEAAVNRPDLAPDKTAVMGPLVPGRRPVPGNDIGHPADVPKAASQSGSRYAIQTHDPRRAAAGSVPLNLDTTLVNVALPALVRELHATTTQLLWVVDSFNLVFAALLLTFGSCPTGSAARACCWPGWPCSGAPAWPAASRPTRRSSSRPGR